MMESYYTALRLNPGLVLKGVLWHQGENDVGNYSYHHDLHTFITNVREDVLNVNLPFICGTMLKSYKDGNYNTQYVDMVHKDLPNTVWLTDCVVLDDLVSPDMQSDFIHFSAKAQRIMGIRYFEAFKKVEQRLVTALEEWNKLNST